MSERQGPAHGLSEHELSEIRMLIEERTGICFDESRARFFSTRVKRTLARQGTRTRHGFAAGHAEIECRVRSAARRTSDAGNQFFPLSQRVSRRLRSACCRNCTSKSSGRTRARCASGARDVQRARSLIPSRLPSLDSLSFSDSWNVEILATDVGRQALKHAERGVYSGRSLASVNPRQLAEHFTEIAAGHQVKPRLRKLVTFAQMNLASAVYVGRMDMIFCMNVLIYFSEERRHALVQTLLRHAGARRLSFSRPFGIHFENARKISGHCFG